MAGDGVQARREVAAAEPSPEDGEPDVAALLPVVRRVVAARVRDAVTVDDLVQETLVRVLGATARLSPALVEAYAIVTARSPRGWVEADPTTGVRTALAPRGRENAAPRRNQHRVVDLRLPPTPD